MKNFKTYHLAIEFYRLAATIKLPGHLKNQFDRASASISLNLAEGSGRFSRKDQKRFYHISFGSLRECQAILDLAEEGSKELMELTDKLAAHLYCLIRS